MTAQTPAFKASGVSALLTSLATVPPRPQPSVKEDFLAVMVQALIAGPDGTDHSTEAQPAQDKPSAKGAAVPDPPAAGLLPAWLAPPLFVQPESPLHKAAASSVGGVPSDPAAPTAPAQGASEKPSSVEAADDPTVAGMLLALLAPPPATLPRSPSHKASAPSHPVIPSALSAPPGAIETAGEGKPAKTEATEKTPLLPAQTPPTKEAEIKPPPTSGTSVADTSQRMSFTSETNEIAGRMEQKLPPPGVSAVSSADTSGSSPDGRAKSSLAFSWHEAPSEPLAIIDFSAKTTPPAAPVAEAAVESPVGASSTAPVERLEQMISREVVHVRQTGAQTLGVTLNLDVNTRLYLQLTTENGLVQASVRCDRGNFAPEDAQWSQLQQSLARQNVELLPMSGGSNLSFQESGQERPRHPATREDWPPAGPAATPARPRPRQKEQNHSRKNWETWA